MNYHSWYYQARSAPPEITLAPVEPLIAGQEGSEDHPPAHEPRVLSVATVLAIAGGGPLVDLEGGAPLISGQESAYVMVLGEQGLVPPNAGEHAETPPGPIAVVETVAQMLPGQDHAASPTWPVMLEPHTVSDHVETPMGATVPEPAAAAVLAASLDAAPIPTWPIPVPPYGIEDSQPPFIIQLQDQSSVGGTRTFDWPTGSPVRVRIRRVSGSADTRLAIQGSSITITYHERT